jgi:hypothetical protein
MKVQRNKINNLMFLCTTSCINTRNNIRNDVHNLSDKYIWICELKQIEYWNNCRTQPLELRTRSSSLGGLELRVSFTLVWKLELTVNVEIRSKSQQHFNTTNLRVCTTGFTLIYKLTYLHKPIMMSMLRSKKYVIYYIDTTVFRLKRLNNRTRRVRFFNHLTRKTVVLMICNIQMYIYEAMQYHI